MGQYQEIMLCPRCQTSSNKGHPGGAVCENGHLWAIDFGEGRVIKRFVRSIAGPITEFVMPIGKYRGQKLSIVPVEYLTWAEKNFEPGNLKTRIREFLNTNGGIKE